MHWKVSEHRNVRAQKKTAPKRPVDPILHPIKAEVRMKIHWIAHHVPDGIIRRVLDGYGRVEETPRDVWRSGGFKGCETTAPILRMTLNNGTTLERLPHQLVLAGGTSLVVIPGHSSMSSVLTNGPRAEGLPRTAM